MLNRKYFLIFISLASLLLTGCSCSKKKEHHDSETSEVTPSPIGDRNISLYGINDFHGSIVYNSKKYERGISALGGFLKSKKTEPNTLLINSGDMWQGSIASNYNRGKLLTDINNYIEFDCFTLGNHEFDWGVDYIKENRARKGYLGDGEGYQTPFLAANIYDYDISTNTVGDYSDLGGKYNIVTLENGLKVGIIGVIGADQITSITSTYVDNLTFLDPVEVTKEIALDLKTNQQCDAVILSAHAPQDDLANGSDINGITSLIPNTDDRYVDAVFCAHSHYAESQIINGVPFVQAGCNGRYYDNIELTVKKDGSVVCTKYEYIYSSTISDSYCDETIESLIAKYGEDSNPVGQEYIGYASGNLSGTGEMPNLVTYAMSLAAADAGYDIDYALCNKARDTIYYGDVTYQDVFKAIPFDNEVYIIDVTGDSLINELKYNYMTRIDEEAISSSKTYRIAVIDYLATHRNSARSYDYFPGFTMVGTLQKEDYDIYNYRDITCDYLRTLGGTITSSNYSSSLNRHNRGLINQDIEL